MTTVIRPRAAQWTAIGLSLLLVVAALLGWRLLPENIQVLFTGVQLATLVFFVLVMVAVMLGVGLSSVRADAEGLTIRNGVRTHHVGWDDIEGFRFSPHDPWAYLLTTSEPGIRPMLALQRVDGGHARRALETLDGQWRQHRDGS